MARMTRDQSKASWLWFVIWVLPGALLGLGVSSLGIFTIPLALVVIVVLHRAHSGLEAWGSLAGVGAVVTFIGAINLDYQPCSESSGRLVLHPGESSVSYSCGGVDGLPWLIVGLCLVGVALAIYLVLRHRAFDGPPGG